MKRSISVFIFCVLSLIAYQLLAFDSNSNPLAALADQSDEILLQKLSQQALAERSSENLDIKIHRLAEDIYQIHPEQSISDTYHRLLTKFDQDHWSVFNVHRFSLLRSLFRAQGVATDNRGKYWFASQLAIISTNSPVGMATNVALMPYPEKLKNLGLNHIGDIDYADGKIYASLEDGPKYQNPYIGVYDARTLSLLSFGRLPVEQQGDGVPWVAADANHGRLYSAKYSDCVELNIYDLLNFKPKGKILLSQTLKSVQGAKVHGDFMYLTANDQPRGYAIYKVNLNTGTVIPVAHLPDDLNEVEGLTLDDSAGTLAIQALGLVPYFSNGFAQKFRHAELIGFHQDHPSLRDQLLKALSAN